MPQPRIYIAQRPVSEFEIRKIAEKCLISGGAVGKLPTPIDDLILAAGIDDVPDPQVFKEQFLESLPKNVRSMFNRAWQKIRGIADLRERAVYVPKTTTLPRVRFAKGHELGHQVLNWHNTNSAYKDDDSTLNQEVQDLFDIEANFFASEIIFQGVRFTNRVRDYQPSFEAVFLIAEEHGTSRHATLHRYVEEQDEAIAAVVYWPSKFMIDKERQPVLWRGRIVCSPRFIIKKYRDIQIPFELRSGHPWLANRNSSKVCADYIKLDCGNCPIQFQWQAWWNSYSLLVLIRRRPLLKLVGQLIRNSK